MTTADRWSVLQRARRTLQRRGLLGTARALVSTVRDRRRSSGSGPDPAVTLVLAGLRWSGSELEVIGRLESADGGPAPAEVVVTGVEVQDRRFPIQAVGDCGFRAVVRPPTRPGRHGVRVRLATPVDRAVPFGRSELRSGPQPSRSAADRRRTARPRWRAPEGLVLQCLHFGARITEVESIGADRLRLVADRRPGQRLVVGAGDRSVRQATVPVRGGWEVSAAELNRLLRVAPGAPAVVSLMVRSGPRSRPVRWDTAPWAAHGIRLRSEPGGSTVVEAAVDELLVDRWEVGGETVRLFGQLVGSRTSAWRVRLQGTRQHTEVRMPVGPDGAIAVELPLRVGVPWSGASVWLWPDRYDVLLIGPAGAAPRPARVLRWVSDRDAVDAEAVDFEAVDAEGVIAATVLTETTDQVADDRWWPTDSGAAVRVVRRPGGQLAVQFQPRLVVGERTDRDQDRWRAAYVRSTSGVTPGTVLFSSFGGRSTLDNVGPIAELLADALPVRDAVWAQWHPGVEVPAGARPVPLGSAGWWAALEQAEVLVTNAWLPAGFTRRPGQLVLQTWHGTPLKRLGLDRTEFGVDAARTERMRRHARLWDVFLAQNAYSVEIFARAYQVPAELTGYPRNDRLVRGHPPARLAALRAGLGIGPDQQVVLYAPTFRTVDGRSSWHAGLDLARLVRELGPRVRLLVRGHSNVASDVPTQLAGIIDVTLVPDLTELFALSDVLLTDYSSAMFDFALTGRPMVFFVPDLNDYRRDRGLYFDLTAQAPGPVTVTIDEAVTALVAALAGTGADHYAERYAAWRATYLSYDDGHATERAVAALLAARDRTSG